MRLKDILICCLEAAAFLGFMVAVYFLIIMLCALNDKCATFYGMI